MTVIWFSDEDRQRMREEAEQHAKYLELYDEFMNELRSCRKADRNAEAVPWIETGHIKPWLKGP